MVVVRLVGVVDGLVLGGPPKGALKAGVGAVVRGWVVFVRGGM